MNTVHRFTPKEINGVFDVCVCGGGLAGVAAAVSAAREGSRVILIEKYGFLGGMATAGLVNPFMKWKENGPSDKLVNAGIFTDLLRRIYETGGSRSPDSRSFMEEFMKLSLDRLVREYPNIKVLFHSLLTDVYVSDGVIESVTVSGISGNIKIKAKIFIDATGNADLSAFSGFAYKLGRDEDGLCQPMTLNFRLSHVDRTKLNLVEINKKYRALQASGEIKNPREDVLYFSMPLEDILHLNTTRIVGKNSTDVEEYTESEFEAREQVYEMYRFMRENVAGCENAHLIMSGTELGIRESRRIVGEYEITEDDIVSARKFEDSIARGSYGVDIHNPAGGGTRHASVPPCDYYTIPYRSLIPNESKNLIAAGRPISSTHAAHSAFRIMPICTCIGEAAGTAAHFAGKENLTPREVDVSALREVLISHGALL